jgi:phytoene dehydrogenase-like protein
LVQACDAIIIGAGPAGLATAAMLRRRGLNPLILEKSDAVGAVWRRHYDRLHLHTDRARSGLPGLAIPKACGRYPSRAQVVEYLEAYAACNPLKSPDSEKQTLVNASTFTGAYERLAGLYWRLLTRNSRAGCRSRPRGRAAPPAAPPEPSRKGGECSRPRRRIRLFGGQPRKRALHWPSPYFFILSAPPSNVVTIACINPSLVM